MKTTVEIGYGYALRSEMGGEVTDAQTGKLLETLEPNKQVHMTAQEPEWIVPDDCQVTKMRNFNHALAALRLLGGGDKLPAGYTRVEFLESTGTQYINTEYSEGCTAKFRYAILRASVYADYWGRWGRAESLPNSRGTIWMAAKTGYFNLYACFNVGAAYVKGQFYDVTHELCDNNLTLALTVNGVRRSAGANGTYKPTSYHLFDTRGHMACERLGYCSISSAGKLVREFLPALDPTGAPCMLDLVTRKPFRNAGSGQFIAGLTLQQAAQLGKLPAGTTLTISLPVGYDSDAGVVAALAEAEANGCVLTVQTYEAAGAAAATFALRRVWVRRVQDENGSYVAADGSRWQVEWCVDVIGADPESLGYERFRSVEAAVAYWELVPYVEPETEEIAD